MCEVVGGTLPAGSRMLTWDLKDSHGRPVPTGLYWLRARTPQGVFTVRAAVVR